MSGQYIALAIVLIAALFAWRYFQRPSAPRFTDNDVAEEMKLRAGQAVETAADDFDTSLDYSPESVEHVETILARLHDQYAQTRFDEKRLTKESLKWGGYVGEVIKTQHACNWALDSSVGGDGSLPIVYDDNGESFPVRWCYKRIVNGDEDNVWHKFTYFVLERDNPDAFFSTSDDLGAEDR